MASTQEEMKIQQTVSNMRFMQTIFASVGGAIMFGLVGAGANALINLASTAVTTAMTTTATHAGLTFGAALMTAPVLYPVLGLAAIAALSLTCVYAGAKYMTSVISLDQQTQAQKIAKAHNGKSAEVDIQPTRIEKTNFIPGVTGGDKASEAEARNDKKRLVEANSTMNQAASRIDAGSAAADGRVQNLQLQRA